MTRPPCVRLCPAYPGNPRTRIEGESPPLCKGTYGLRRREAPSRRNEVTELDNSLRRDSLDPRRAASCAAHQAARARAGGGPVAPRHHAGDDGGVIAVDLLQQTPAAHGQIVMYLRRMQMQPVV